MFACSYSLTLSRLYTLYDMGINATTRFYEIVFLVFPFMLIVFFITLGVTKALVTKVNLNHWKTFALVVFFQLSVYLIFFINKFSSLRDYGVPPTYNLKYFLSHFFSK